jgi:peroxiredoxin
MDIKKRTPFLLTIIGIPIFFITVLQAKDQSSPSPKISSAVESFRIQRFEEKRVAPPFTLKSLEGKTIALSDFKGKPVLLVFWATWCPICKEELPLLEKFSEGKRDQLAILMVTVDGEREKKAQKIIKENKITLPVALLLKEKVMENYGVKGWIPLIFLIDPEGLIVGKIVGPRDWSKPEAWSALKEIFSLH